MASQLHSLNFLFPDGAHLWVWAFRMVAHRQRWQSLFLLMCPPTPDFHNKQRGWTLMQSYFWPAADYNWRWPQTGTSLQCSLPALVRHSFPIPSLKLLTAVVRFYGSAALQHSLARSASDLWAVETQTLSKNIGDMYCYCQSACLASPVGTRLTLPTWWKFSKVYIVSSRRS